MSPACDTLSAVTGPTSEVSTVQPKPIVQRFQTASVSRRVWAVLAAVLLTAVALVGVSPATARADIQVAELVVQGELGADGMLAVTETYTFTGDLPGSFVKKFHTRENGIGDVQYVQQIEGVTATVAGRPATVQTSVGADTTTVTVSDAAGPGPLVLTYTVRGAVRAVGQDNVFQYQVLQGLDLVVQKVTAIVSAPAPARGISCYAGAPNSTGACSLAAQGTFDNPSPTWEDGPRGAGEQVTAIAPFDPADVAASAIIDHRWSLGRAFGVGPAELLGTVAVLLIGGALLWVLHRRAGRDASAGDQRELVGEFAPVGEGESEFRHFGTVRPGHVGTVSDERVDPIDITASLVDLAVRGHLLITELPRERAFAPAEWTITARGAGSDDLSPFEEKLIAAVTSGEEDTTVSKLAPRVHAHVAELQDALYDEVVERGWYERRPDATRNKWVTLALGALMVAVVGTGALVAFTSFGLLGLALVAVCLGLVFVAQEMPARTAGGAALLAGLRHLSEELRFHATDEMPKGRELEELSELLPYAIVLGGVDRWLDAIVAADGDDDPDSTDLDWYHGPDDWHLQDLPDSLRNFVTTVSGSMFSR